MWLLVHNGDMLAYASVRLRDDHDIVAAAVTQKGMALQFASQKSKENLGIVLAAVNK
jgi:hypothetical protein